jgi:hypothetical protein
MLRGKIETKLASLENSNLTVTARPDEDHSSLRRAFAFSGLKKD